MNVLKVLSLGICAVIATGCGYSVKLNIKRAPELNLVGVKQVKVDPFAVNGNLSLDVADTGNNLLGAVAGLAIGAGVNKLAEGKNPALQDTHLRGIKSAIAQNGYYTVNEASEFDAKIGGNLDYNVKDEITTVTNKDQNGKVTTSYELRRKADVNIRFGVTDKTGTIIGNSTVHSSVSKTWSGATKNDARSNAQEWDAMVRDAIDSAHTPLIRKIAPYFVTETRDLEKGDSDLIKEGNKSAEKGDWSTASSLWNQGMNTGKDEDRVAATYNLAVYDEVEGRLEDALKKFEDVFKSTNKSRHGRDVARTRNRIDEENRLKKADAARKT